MTQTSEADLLAAIAQDPTDVAARMVYADYLEQQGDRRDRFIREHLRVAPLEPDHPERLAGEEALSRERVGLDPAWLAVIEPRRRCYHPQDSSPSYCYSYPMTKEELRQALLNDDPPQEKVPDDDDERLPTRREIELHWELQDTECEGWHRLLDYIDRVAADGTPEFAPRRALTDEQWRQIITLPPTIAKLTSVTSIVLYQSYLVRIPPEIGAMASLRSFDSYQSYRLHWYPYEITRCRQLRDSTISTRALYGNYKHRSSFPRLTPSAPREHGPIRPCSVCDRPFEDRQRFRVWISLRVATDVLPLLVNACSPACVERLPTPPEDYTAGPHRGGIETEQPPPGGG